MFEIPPAPTGFPVAWQGHWYGRRGESLTALDFDKLDTLRNETDGNDWTAAIANLLTSLRRAGKIVNTRSRKYPLWRLNDAKGSIEAKPGVQKENAQ